MHLSGAAFTPGEHIVEKGGGTNYILPKIENAFTTILTNLKAHFYCLSLNEIPSKLSLEKLYAKPYFL